MQEETGRRTHQLEVIVCGEQLFVEVIEGRASRRSKRKEDGCKGRACYHPESYQLDKVIPERQATRS